MWGWFTRRRLALTDQEITVLGETDDYSIWSMEDPDGEVTYHLELGNMTIHFFREEWDQFLELVRPVARV
jgi:hypothetical protein